MNREQSLKYIRQEHLYEIEKEAGIAEDQKAFYIIYPDETASNWRIQAVSVSPDSFENRLSLPENWRGLRDEALSKESGIPGCIFIHSSGFIGGTQSDRHPPFAMKSLIILFRQCYEGRRTQVGDSFSRTARKVCLRMQIGINNFL